MEQAIIDFIIVVLGILFALFINKLNERRMHINRINNIMTIVIKDMENDISAIDRGVKSVDLANTLKCKYLESKDIADELLINCKMIPFHFNTFVPQSRGYNLLKDATVNFNFKNSDLITEILHFYDGSLPHINSTQALILNIISNNTEDISKYSWYDSAINYDSNSKDYLDYMRIDDFKHKLVYTQSIKNVFSGQMLLYRERISKLLKMSIESDYK